VKVEAEKKMVGASGSKILSDSEIVYYLLSKKIIITPLLDCDQVKTTVDLRLGTEFVVKRMDRYTHLNPIEFNRIQKEDPDAALQICEVIKRLEPQTPFILHPNHFALACTLEYIFLPAEIGGMLEGRSSWAREGLNVHSTAGIIHPGHKGIIVFELSNSGSHPIPLYPGMRVAQLLLYELTTPTQNPYGSDVEAKYTKYVATNFGRPWEDWEFDCLAEKSTSAGKLEEK
jgi:dCTP deaminase